MTVHFEDAEFALRRDKLLSAMEAEELDALLLFAQESMYWLTGYDTFGFCFFQCLVVRRSGEMTLLTRSADLRQAQQTSVLQDIRVWVDHGEADPLVDLRALLLSLDLLGSNIGVEYDTQGLTGANARALDDTLRTFANLSDASALVWPLRAVKSAAEIACVREAARLGDLALLAAVDTTKAGADEGDILAAMQGAVFSGGGDYAGNEFVIGSGADALLCRYKSGRRVLSENDQLTIEFAGVWRHYHAALMRTLIIGKPRKRHLQLFDAAFEALCACEEAMQIGNTFGAVFDAHAGVMDAHALYPHRLNACGYSLGAHFTPSWMDKPMFYQNNPHRIEADMVLFAHMILMDSESETAMCLGRTYLTTPSGPTALSGVPLDLIRR